MDSRRRIRDERSSPVRARLGDAGAAGPELVGALGDRRGRAVVGLVGLDDGRSALEASRSSRLTSTPSPVRGGCSDLTAATSTATFMVRCSLLSASDSVGRRK